MNFKEKLKLLYNFEDIFFIKTGKFIHHKNKCYKVPKLFTMIFKFYYYSGIAAMILLFIFLLSPHIFDNLLLQFLQSLVIFMLLEIIFLFLLPLKIIPCWEENIKFK